VDYDVTTRERTVLVVDDDLDVAQALVRTLRQHGYTTLVANDGFEALELVRSTDIDLLLTDIDMPRMDGVTLAMHVRQERPEVVRILLTGNARLDTALTAINRGEVHRYLTKPWSALELVHTIDDAFARLAELSRLAQADQSALRLRAARDALELEYPGITRVRAELGAYVVDLARAKAVGQALGATDLGLLLALKIDEEISDLLIVQSEGPGRGGEG